MFLLRRIKWLDDAIVRLDPYEKFISEWIGPFTRQGAIRLGVGAAMSGTSWLFQSWIPFSIMVGLMTYVALVMLSKSNQLKANAAERQDREAIDTPALDDLKNTELDLIYLLDSSVNNATMLYMHKLAYSIDHAIATNDENFSNERFVGEREFLMRVRGAVAGTYRELDLSAVLSDAQYQAEEAVRRNRDTIPPGMDILQLREWKISRSQTLAAIEYLMQQKFVVEERLISQRTKLIERLRRRSPS